MLALARCAIASTRATPRPLRQNSNVAARRIDSLVRAESRVRLLRGALRVEGGDAVVSVTGLTLPGLLRGCPIRRTPIRRKGCGIEIAVAATGQVGHRFLHAPSC